MINLNIDNKKFVGKYDDNGSLIISLSSNKDILFFKNWIDEMRVNRKKEEYSKNITFTKVTGHGILVGCWPILNNNEDTVRIVYDCYLLD